jgi:hypothetical protein
MSCLKKDATPEMVAAVQSIENRADECYKPLTILQLPANDAIWALLAGGIQMIEQEVTDWSQDSPYLSAALQNVSRLVPIALKWAVRYGNPYSVKTAAFWSLELGAMVNQALAISSLYSHFETCFPMWHRSRYLGDLMSQSVVRFTALGGVRDRQMSAYQKGLRPNAGPFKAQRAQRRETPLLTRALFDLVLQGAFMTGYASFLYDDPWTLWRELLPEYQARVSAIGRRTETLSVGTYTLKEFEEFYAALLAVCAAHEFLCFEWGQGSSKIYPVGSVVMVRSHQAWAELLSDLSNVAIDKCKSIISDLSFDFDKSLDLHVNPFIPLGTGGALAVAPQFPLHSQCEENILRICSVLRPRIYDAMSDEKENDMISELKTNLNARDIRGPILLPNGVPDIDLLVTDETSSALVIAELKWIRKSLAPKEGVGKEAEVLKGVSQLVQVRKFLTANPDYLTTRMKLLKPFREYEHVHYLLIPRDYCPWIHPVDGISLVEFDAFKKAMLGSENLHDTVLRLLTYEWLPIEGRDFSVRYDRAAVNGVAVESEVFYSTNPLPGRNPG